MKFFREFPSEDILINEVENRWIEIGNDKVQYHIVGMNPDDFPETPHITEVDFFPLMPPFLKK
jgi:DNA polymerase-3 subunit beta